ncbi:uncharacterized protein EI97DRAFT_461243 [Westerdykella ornata]|uniref:Uncharacterized protein n=1 Tax=Westerdykella ornata TaxID=318751 RepID=A0A6A6JDV9_WESOR|nr:uncharacterized protein EI97DRAFT_461243 [Westerdykella ornata]KAF2273369.1 hypothetical protein EI97DRAFT_461243 [Westerdykella ornata]
MFMRQQQLGTKLVQSSNLHLKSSVLVSCSITTTRPFSTPGRRQNQEHPKLQRPAPSYTTGVRPTASCTLPLAQQPKTARSRLHTSAACRMASDDAYAAFLEKANQDVSGGAGGEEITARSSSSADKRIRIQEQDVVEVPASLRGIEEVYVSESDEGFEGVGLGWEGGEVDADSLRKALSLSSDTDVSSLSEKEFDPRGNYTSVIDKVKRAGNGSVKIFRIELDATRAEIWVLSVDEKGKRLVGVRTLSVET